MRMAYRQRLCWVCGGVLGRHLAFVVGPMCIVNRTSGEPPSHRECATFSARACPFLTKPAVKRRENDIPDESVMHEANLMRNPGVAAVYITATYEARRDPDGKFAGVFKMGEPEEILYFCEGREATRAEIMHSIETGIPLLREVAAKEGPEAEKYLEEMYQDALRLVPA